jgi:glycosyltransferase involved in cell wall biosynthesis
MSHLISVIVPVYNVELYLDKCITSLLRQTYNNLEIILVNDGSTDNSLEICEKYQLSDNRIFIINKKNGGLSSARNAGINIAKGTYLSFVDSDDWVEEDFIDTLYNQLEKYNADISQCGSIQEVIQDNGISRNAIIRSEEVIIMTGIEALINLQDRKTYLDNVVAWNKLYKRELFESLRYPEGMNHEDIAIIHELLYSARTIAVNRSTLYHYIQRTNSITSSKFNIKKLDTIHALERRLDFFHENNEPELIAITLPHYFRALLANAAGLFFSSFDNKKIYLDEILAKINKSINHFSMNKYMSRADKLLLAVYRTHPILGFYANNSLPFLKKIFR